MTLHRRGALKAAVAASCAALFPHGAFAQAAWPGKPVRLVVPLTPGSGADIVARILGRKLQEMWGQPVVIENRPGAGGQIGTQAVIRAPADGLTLLVQSASHAANVAIYKTLPYDPLRELSDVALLATTPYVMVVSSTGPYKSVKLLVDAARAKPQGVFFASAGVGTSTHLAAEMFAERAKLELAHVPFKGSPDAINDVAGGNTAFYMAPFPTVAGMLKDGRLTPIATTADKRIADLPQVPTIAESGYPGFNNELWIGLWASSATPAPVLAKLSADVTRALQAPDVQEQYAKSGNHVNLQSPEQFAKFVRAEIETNRAIVRRANIQLE